MKIKNRELRVEQKKIQRAISNHTVGTKKILLGFKKNFKAFREFILPTKKQFKDQLCEENREHIYTTLDKIDEDGRIIAD